MITKKGKFITFKDVEEYCEKYGYSGLLSAYKGFIKKYGKDELPSSDFFIYHALEEIKSEKSK